MFNFFSELKGRLSKVDSNLFCEYNIVNMSGRLLYAEGHCGITVITQTSVAFKLKKGRAVVEGKDLVLSELTENTLLLQGKIDKVEIF